MRYLTCAALLVPVCALAGVRMADESALSLGSSGDLQLLALYASALCAWMLFRSLRRRDMGAAIWSVALVLTAVFPTFFALLLFALLTALIVLLGLSRR